MALPLLFAGPTLRLSNLSWYQVCIALSEVCAGEVLLCENQIEASDAEDSNLSLCSANPGAKTIHTGDELHLVDARDQQSTRSNLRTQLRLTSDEIYANEVPHLLLRMLRDAVTTLFAATLEQLAMRRHRVFAPDLDRVAIG